MIENEEIWIKIIFKKYLETHKSSWNILSSQTYFALSNIK